jgi:hypothetical protein
MFYLTACLRSFQSGLLHTNICCLELSHVGQIFYFLYRRIKVLSLNLLMAINMFSVDLFVIAVCELYLGTGSPFSAN